MSAYVMQQRRANDIAELAHSVADFYFPDSWIDPEVVIRKNQVTLSFGRYRNSFDGMLEWRPSGFHIYCNLDRVVNSTSDRARFTLGHELGHYFIDSHRNALRSGRAPSHPSFCSEAQSKSAVEAEANHFASHLLMPQDRAVKVLPPTRNAVSISDVELLQESFRVSFQSAAIRAVNTAERVGCACVFRNSNGKVWYVVSPAFEAAGYMNIRRDDRPLLDGCATAECLASEAEEDTAGRRFESVTTASQWFYRVAVGSGRDVILDETAIRLGAYGVFTLLTQHKMRTRLS
jgi:hypothetical protein